MSLFAALLLAAPHAQDLKCPHRPTLLNDPVIRDEDAAKQVFSAIADQFMGGEDFSGYRIVIQGDTGDRVWTIYHLNTDGRRKGGMAMTIDRCTGAISKLHYQR